MGLMYTYDGFGFQVVKYLNRCCFLMLEKTSRFPRASYMGKGLEVGTVHLIPDLRLVGYFSLKSKKNNI